MKDDRVYLRYIQECIRRLEENISGGRQQFMSSHTLQDAVLRSLQTLAESAQRLSDQAKSRRPEIPWRAIAGFRNVLVHNYLGIDLDRVWEVVERDVPELKRVILAMLAEIA